MSMYPKHISIADRHAFVGANEVYMFLQQAVFAYGDGPQRSVDFRAWMHDSACPNCDTPTHIRISR